MISLATKEQPVYSRPITTETGLVGTVRIMAGQEPADVIYRFVKEHKLGAHIRDGVMADACSKTACTRTAAEVFTSPVATEAGAVAGTLRILEGEEPADVIYRFVKAHGLAEGYRTFLMNHACNQVTCTRLEAEVYSQAITTDGVAVVGTVRILEGEEPADVVYAFCKKHGLLETNVRNGVMVDACGKIPCARAEATVFASPVASETGAALGVLSILEGQEPADVVYAFCRKHSLGDHYREGLMKAACAQTACTRRDAVVYTSPVAASETGQLVGTLVIMEKEEPADVIYTFCEERKLGEEYRTGLMQAACAKTTCTRLEATVYSRPVADGDGATVGTVRILEGEEPADAVYEFCTKHALGSEYRHALMVDACGKVTCTREKATVYSRVFKTEEGKEGTVAVMEGEEPADVVYRYCKSLGLPEGFQSSILEAVCGGMPATQPCTRRTAKLYSKRVANATGAEIGAVEVMEGEEPVRSYVCVCVCVCVGCLSSYLQWEYVCPFILRVYR